VAGRIFEAIGRPELSRDVRFGTNEARLEHADELDALVAEWIGDHTLQEVMAAFEDHEAAASPVYDVQQIATDLQYRARGTLVRVPDPELGEVVLPDVQPRFSETPGRVRHPGLPLGAANREVFVDELGLDPSEVERLKAEGVI
jgi:formyl-CoA transferase